jgi:hypothetical protein
MAGTSGGKGGKGGGGKGGKGGGGKGGGGKGKKGGFCPVGAVPICLDPDLWQQVKDAFDAATISTGPLDGCGTGLRKVCLDRGAATDLLFALAIATQTGTVKNKKGKGKGK